jgi:hypothetical protein
MNVFSRFLDEVNAMEPDTDHAELADVLHAVQYNDDEIALELFPKIRWVISRKHEPVMARLLMVERLISKFVTHH